jgi:hypothetical protein
VVVHDLDIVYIASSPYKADAPLLIYSNAMLPGTIANKLFQAIFRWNS